MSEEADPKQRKLRQGEAAEECASASELALKPFMGELEEIQKQLQDLDEECARKQLEIQKNFDSKKKPVLERRQRVLDQIPGFWGEALRNHPDLVLTSPDDEAVLKHLKAVDLEDNLDEAGSYRIKFVRTRTERAGPDAPNAAAPLPETQVRAVRSLCLVVWCVCVCACMHACTHADF